MLRRSIIGEVRQPAVAGLFYPEQPAALRGMVQGFLQDADEPQRTPKALIAPHAGFEYSGAIAGTAFRQLAAARDTIVRVVLAGPSHRVPFQGIALCSARRFATPLGEVPVDEEAQARIAGHPDVVALDVAHQEEHSLETHLPFLQLALGRFAIVPLVLGDTSPRDVARVFETLWGGPETLICVSSDLSHYLSYDEARRRDTETSRAIERLDPESIDHDQACGRTAIQALLLCAKKHGLKAITLDQRNSGDTAGPKDRVVGYGAYAFV
jgi:AmmeMemoRadiSam system protein B